MEGFLEANRVVEISLSKLSTMRSSDLPLRKTLFISQVLNRAQDMATSAQDCLLSSPHIHSSRRNSKLLASFGHDQSHIDDLPASQPRTLKPPLRQQSPIAMECYDVLVPSDCHTSEFKSSEEPMDFNHVTSFLGDILDSDSDVSDVPHTTDLDQNVECTPSSSATDKLQSDGWCDAIRPVSPGKRNYQQAFPFAAQSPDDDFEDLKRFKSYTVHDSPLDTLPSFCGYLSSKNLQTAPFITYMFGRGFTHPSNPNSNTCDWPVTRTDNIVSELISPLKNSPILAF